MTATYCYEFVNIVPSPLSGRDPFLAVLYAACCPPRVIKRVILGITDFLICSLSAKLGNPQTTTSSTFLLKLQIKELPRQVTPFGQDIRTTRNHPKSIIYTLNVASGRDIGEVLALISYLDVCQGTCIIQKAFHSWRVDSYFLCNQLTLLWVPLYLSWTISYHFDFFL